MLQHLIDHLIRPQVQALSAYHVADANGYIKLDAMENPYSWPQDLQAQWLEQLKGCALNRYPDPQAKSLATVLRQHNQLPDSSAILLGNGSDEIIQILLMALPENACIIAPEPSFVMYKQVALSLGLRYQGVALNAEDFSLDLPAMLQAIEQWQPALIFLAYPNNPTGNAFDTQAMLAILNAAPGLVVVDEAYAPFADDSFMQQLPNFPQLLVMRTVSKLGLAGLRLGFLAGHPDLLAQFDKIRLPYNINCLTQATAEFALQHSEFLLAQTQEIREQRRQMVAALQALPEIKVYPSQANFLLLKTLQHDAQQIFASLKQQGILIKNLAGQGGVLSNCLRVTIGTPQENQAFLTALHHALNDNVSP